MVIYIRNMVSLRCKILVKQELEQLGVSFIVIDSGEVKLTEKLSFEKRGQLKETLLKSGLEVMDDKKSIIIEKIKRLCTPEEVAKAFIYLACDDLSYCNGTQVILDGGVMA